MRCYRRQKLIILYLHDELADEARRRLERHLDQCSMCQERLKGLRAVIERAAQRDIPAPSACTVDLIRQTAKVAVADPRRRAVGVLWGHRWYGARVGMVAAVSCGVLVAAVVLTISVLGRRSSQPPYEPPLYVTEPSVPRWTEEEVPLNAVALTEGREGFMEPARAPSGLEAQLANLEADTFYIDQLLAREMMPVFDRRVHGLENAGFALALDLERE